MRLVECVPNFSEGRSEKIINTIADAIKSVPGANLLDVDPGWSTNRTVITFVGDPDAVVEAAFQAIATAATLIDMRKHRGEHPRMGATDVCPFIPVQGVTMEDCVKLAQKLAKRVGTELKIPVYLYAEAATQDDRRSLADIRKGEYEGLCERMEDPSHKPDFGPTTFNPQSGATVIGARPFLIAYNVNLNTKSKKLAHEIALNIREAGRVKKNAQGETQKDAQGKPIKVEGTLKACRAVGWYVDEYERAQVSINLIDYNVTSMHQAFDECSRQAEALGLRVTGSEVVGLVPLEPMLAAGRYYLAKQNRSTGVSQKELITTAVQSLGLSDLSPFDPQQKIIEYKVAGASKNLKNLSMSDFVDELASESAAPGGGSVAALCGSLSAALSSMVANLTFEKKGFETKRTSLAVAAEHGQELKKELLEAVDRDKRAFDGILEARRLPKATPQEQEQRNLALLNANKNATLVPFEVLNKSLTALELAHKMATDGNPNSLSDVGVAGLTALAAAEGAYYNILINLSGFDDEADARAFVKETRSGADALIDKARASAERLTTDVLKRLGGEKSLICP